MTRPALSRRRVFRGFSLVEATVAVVLVALVLVGALHVLGGTTASTHQSAQGDTGLLLAEHLMAEVLGAAYADPDQDPVFGPEPGESGGNRSGFDDVDDFHDWTDSPPKNPDGGNLGNFAGWTRTVAIAYLNPNDPQQTQGFDAGLKQVTVTASFGGKPRAELVTVRADCEPDE